MNPLFLHVDGDGFFASCEVAKHPELKGKPVVVGRERGMAIAMNYPAKWLGVTRGMPIHEITRRFPEVVIRDADHESYTYFSHRMNDILGRYTNHIEKYSIDESFAEISGALTQGETPEHFAHTLSRVLTQELGMTFSIGVGPTKVLAKLGSRMHKPQGITIITKELRESVLASTPIGDVWGIGRATALALENMGVSTAGRFVAHPASWVRLQFPRPIQDLWYELSGISVLPLVTARTPTHASLLRTRTFSRATKDTRQVTQAILSHIEILTTRLRKEGAQAGSLTCVVLTHDRMRHSRTIHFLTPQSTAMPMIEAVRPILIDLLPEGDACRATSVTLSSLTHGQAMQPNLWDTDDREHLRRKACATVDLLNTRGDGIHLRLASTLHSARIFDAHTASDTRTWHIGIPDLGEIT